MADIIELAAEKRTEFGKGAARRIRRDDKVGRGRRDRAEEGAGVGPRGRQGEFQIAGEKELLALPKQVQRDPIKGFVEHVDLLIVKRGENVTVEVPVILTGEALPHEVQPGQHQQQG